MFVREMDRHGRIVIPMEIRKSFALNIGDGIAIYTDGGKIVFEKHACVCFVCDGVHDVRKHNKAYLCESCREALTDDNIG